MLSVQTFRREHLQDFVPGSEVSPADLETAAQRNDWENTALTLLVDDFPLVIFGVFWSQDETRAFVSAIISADLKGKPILLTKLGKRLVQTTKRKGAEIVMAHAENETNARWLRLVGIQEAN